MPINWNIPQQITQGDRVTWTEEFEGKISDDEQLKFLIKGSSEINVIGQYYGAGWDFEITPLQSKALIPGIYEVRIVLHFGESKITLDVIELEILESCNS